MQTRLINVRDNWDEAIHLAADLLACGQTVSLPTETVYGLAANALNPEAVARIFTAKERPSFDPLIVHLPDFSWLEEITSIQDADRDLVMQLAGKFWPGALTFVLPKREVVPDNVTSGMDSVAVRISKNKVMSAVLKEFGRPLAAPSANRFGRISPTTGQHVLDELGSRIPLILDDGETDIGLESTILKPSAGQIEILRAGPVTAEELSKYAPVTQINRSVGDNQNQVAPGQLESHYAPQTPLLISDEFNFDDHSDKDCGLITFGEEQLQGKFAEVKNLSPSSNLNEAAANLFSMMREMDGMHLDMIVAAMVPNEGVGVAINDRLRRASAKRSGGHSI